MKVLACDFDGTLYIDGKVRPGDRAAIDRFRAEGNKVGLCSGRWPGDNFKSVLKHAGGLDFYIICSGALILDGNMQVMEEHPAFSGKLGPFLELCRSRGLAPAFGGTGRAFQIEGMAQWVESGDTVLSQEEFLARNEKLYAICVRGESEAQAREVTDLLNARQTETGLVAYQNRVMVDVAPVGCSKGEGLRAIRKRYGLDGPVACIGDSFNDIPMLESTPFSYTFRNSPKEVRDRAAYLVDSVQEAVEHLERL